MCLNFFNLPSLCNYTDINVHLLSLAATDSGPLYTNVFYCGGNIFFTLNLSVPGGYLYYDGHWCS